MHLPENYIAVGIQYLPDGKIVQSFEIKTGIVEILSEQEKNKFSIGVCQGLEEKRNRFMLNFAVKYIQNQKEEYRIGKGVVLTPINYQKESQVYGFEICFASLSVWQFYNDLQSEGVEQNNKLPFFEKRGQTSDFPLANKGEEVGVGRILEDIVLTAFSSINQGENLKKNYTPSFVYCYSTYLSKIKSNADAVSRSSTQYNHIWIEDNIEECEQIEIYYYVYDRGVWLILGLTIPCLGLVIYVIVVNRRSKNQQ